MRVGAPLALLTLAALSSQAASVGAGAGAGSQKITPKVARELLASVCQSGAGTGECTPCPAFTGDQGDTFSPATVIYGHFTDPRATDALMDMGGCEPHVNNFGGSLLLRWQSLTSWKLLRYVQGIRTDQCLKAAAAGGRDLLLCQGSYSGMGTVVENLVLLDLAKPDVLAQNFFSTYDTSQACSPTGSIQQIVNWKLLAKSGSASGLEVRIKSATFTRPRDDTKVHDPCVGKLSAAPSRTYLLTYAFNGGRFALLPAARPALAALKHDNPEFGGGQ
ncbi:hypothetical protein FNU79_07500 [Deinococcus detaillensis]|uniref:Uncharacterized protein n=1 Tax=Deinococcus detaillensis TaxID=2592048 RepID=A0A553V1V3_9DEIO|nr:hypothetical protein [Deinococcus detaillensis]TSA86479.1 hypothetical protein FNU79_07500 [Deinococcus detaillensis]